MLVRLGPSDPARLALKVVDEAGQVSEPSAKLGGGSQ
jgi:hypothetical protein